jgi:hypothetical protein
MGEDLTSPLNSQKKGIKMKLKLSIIVIFVLAIGLAFSGLAEKAYADNCFVQITLKSGGHSIKVDGREIGDNLGPGRYTLECKCMGPIVWIDGQLIALYPNQRYGNAYKINVR